MMEVEILSEYEAGSHCGIFVLVFLQVMVVSVGPQQTLANSPREELEAV